METDLVEQSAVLHTCDYARFRALEDENSSMQMHKALGGGTSAMMRLHVSCRATSSAKCL